MRFDAPWFLVLLAAIPLVVPRETAVAFPLTAGLDTMPRSLPQRLAFLPFWLRVAGLALIVLALARPQIGAQKLRQVGRGIALEMVIDRSSSMASAIEYGRDTVSRLDLAKRVFRDFVAGGGGLSGRGSDLIGVVTFAGAPQTVCPLTFAHENALASLAPVRTAWYGEDGTAIGDSVALAAARLKMLDREPGAPRSKVIVLITDGENNRGQVPVFEAAKLASSWGVRVYTIGIFDVQRHIVLSYYRELRERMQERADRDLGALADLTGGVYRSAQQGDALESVYREIDRLEKSEVPVMRHVRARELYPYLALAALALLALETALAATWLRRAP